jgi:predicted AAA+ superfamily ATPase
MTRSYWVAEILQALTERSVVWLSGVRRAGKTTLAKSLPGARYHDCELVRVRRALKEPELFFRQFQRELVVLDEVRRPGPTRRPPESEVPTFLSDSLSTPASCIG